MPIKSRRHGARKAARIIAKNFARLNRRTSEMYDQLDEVTDAVADLNEVAVSLMKKDAKTDDRIDSLARNHARATDTLSGAIDKLESRTLGLALALIVFGVLLAAAIVVMWSKVNA